MSGDLCLSSTGPSQRPWPECAGPCVDSITLAPLFDRASSQLLLGTSAEQSVLFAPSASMRLTFKTGPVCPSYTPGCESQMDLCFSFSSEFPLYNALFVMGVEGGWHCSQVDFYSVSV